MRNTIYNVIGLGERVRTEGSYGIEIEAEGHFLPSGIDPNDSKLLKTWRIERDPSLKSGLEAHEYVLRKPTSLQGCKAALDALKDSYDYHKSKVVETETSGVHVHMNVQEYTPKELFTLMTTYLVLEELLLTYCGEYREGNHFCLRARDAEGLVYELSQAALKRNLGGLNKEILRYGSLNVFSLFKYGSIEFRAMRGTGDLDAIYEWVEILDALKNGAKQFKTPYDVILSMSEHGEKNFLTTILGPKAKVYIKIKNYEQLIRNGAQLIQSLAFLPDWKAWKDVLVNPFPKGQR